MDEEKEQPTFVLPHFVITATATNTPPEDREED